MADTGHPDLTASVVVRCRNEEASIGAALRSLRAQTLPVEIIVVDSGSVDATLAVAGPFADAIVTMPAATFTFGRSLNLGAARATGSVVFALSAHCVAPDPDWVRRSLDHYRDMKVAGTCGWAHGPRGEDFSTARPITFADIRANPYGRFSNHASSWRRSVWAELPFDETLASCEDQEWLWRVMAHDWKVIADPALVVPSGHRRSTGLRSLWKRQYLEHQVVAASVDLPVETWRGLLDDWWGEFPWPSPLPHWLRRLSPARNVELAAGFLGARSGLGRRGPHTRQLPEA